MPIYSYAELKGKIRVGDEVSAVAGKHNPCGELKDDGSNRKEITKVTDEHFSINNCTHSYSDDAFLTIVKHAPITWENLQEGDVVESADGERRMVLGVSGKVCHLSMRDKFDEFCINYTIKQMQDFGYTIVQPEPETKGVRKMTVQEVSKLVGETVEIVE